VPDSAARRAASKTSWSMRSSVSYPEGREHRDGGMLRPATMKLVAVILAAGEGRRVGRPKAAFAGGEDDGDELHRCGPQHTSVPVFTTLRIRDTRPHGPGRFRGGAPSGRVRH